MALLISKTDFTADNLVKFSQNIPADQIDPQIRAAQEYDLEPRVGSEMLTDLIAERESSTGIRPELAAFLPLVVRYLVLASNQRFLAYHGANITQFGLTRTADPGGTMEALDPRDRAILMRQNAADMNTALSKMTAKVWVFDGVNYEDARSGVSGQRASAIRAPKRSRKNNYSTRLNNSDYGLY